MDIKPVLRKHEEQLTQLPNVISVGIGEKKGNQCIKLNLRMM